MASQELTPFTAKLQHLIESGRYDCVYSLATEGLKEDPESVVYHCFAGIAAIYGNVDLEAGERHLTEALLRDPMEVAALFAIAKLRSIQGKHSEAVEKALAGLSIEPENVNGLNLLTWAYVNLGKYQEARAAASQAIEVSPNNVYTQDALVMIDVLAEKRSIESALESYRLILAEHPELPLLHHRIGVLSSMSEKHRDQALEYISEGLRLSPESNLFQRNLVALKIQTIFERSLWLKILFLPAIFVSQEMALKKYRILASVFAGLLGIGWIISPEQPHTLVVALLLLVLCLLPANYILLRSISVAARSATLPGIGFDLLVGVLGVIGYALAGWLLLSFPLDPWISGLSICSFIVAQISKVIARKKDPGESILLKNHRVVGR